MSDSVLIALIAAIPPALVSIAAVWVSYRKQSARIEQIHVLVNSRLQAALDEIRLLKKALAKKR